MSGESADMDGTGAKHFLRERSTPAAPGTRRNGKRSRRSVTTYSLLDPPEGGTAIATKQASPATLAPKGKGSGKNGTSKGKSKGKSNGKGAAELIAERPEPVGGVRHAPAARAGSTATSASALVAAPVTSDLASAGTASTSTAPSVEMVPAPRSMKSRAIESAPIEATAIESAPIEATAIEVAHVVPSPPAAERQPLVPPTEQPTVLSVAQRIGLLGGLAVLIAASVVAPTATLIAVNTALVLFFMAANSMKVYLISRALNNPCAVSVDVVANRTPDTDLPVYTILLPVYHEAALLPQLVAGILALDYPEDRLDVKLLLEEEDVETRQAADALGLPPCFDVLVVPDVGPTGKPRACNYGLERARGEYLVIFDAEDRPEADQLRKSVLAFEGAGPEIICFQAQLNYFNRTYNMLTRWFAAEYSVWFDQLLPGLQAMDVVIPLGGTSNHFITGKLREIGGWNPFNVTEDADLGLRIYLQGWKTAVLDTTTYEEATSRYHNWIRQRSRWVKGYMQTYLYHMRRPVHLAREMGAKTFLSFQLFFGAGTLCLLLNPIFWLLAVAWFATKMHWIQTAFPGPVLYLATIGLFVGNAACVLSAVSGCFGRRNYEDVKYAFLIPVYWILMSVGAWKALIQLCYKPSYWEKTEHGFCAFDEATGPATATDESTRHSVLTAS